LRQGFSDGALQATLATGFQPGYVGPLPVPVIRVQPEELFVLAPRQLLVAASLRRVGLVEQLLGILRVNRTGAGPGKEE